MKKLVKIYNKTRTITLNDLVQGLCNNFTYYASNKQVAMSFALQGTIVRVNYSFGFNADNIESWFINMFIIKDYEAVVSTPLLIAPDVNGDKRGLKILMGRFKKDWRKFFFKKRKRINISVLEF